MLRKIRILLAILFFALISLLFLDFTGTIHLYFGWLAKVQFVPALLALNVGVVIGLLLLTLLFGRVYCSVICPLGIFQDGVSLIGKKQKKNRFSYSPAKTGLRWIMVAIFIAAFLASIHSVFGLLDPYSSYGRIASNLFAPFYKGGNNILAYLSERAGDYTFYSTEIWIKSLSTFLISLLTFIGIGYLALKNGRTYCNTICPVGTILGLLSRYSLFKPVFDKEKCNKCGLCARNCKAACIDAKNQEIDYSRCVTCMNCLEKCNKNAIKYAPRLKAEKNEPIVSEASSRRRFLSATSVLALTSVVAKAQQVQIHVDGGLADIEDKKNRQRETAIVPPGAGSIRNFTQKCTGCQLCVSVCPNQILRPSSKLTNLMQPEITYEKGYCRPECTKCSEVCPAGAIQRITKADKSAIQIGRAMWIKESCLAYSEDVSCDNCSRHCPVDAIRMVPNKEGDSEIPIPAVDTERCIGCGACENLCPVRPYSAIYVESNQRHRIV